MGYSERKKFISYASSSSVLPVNYWQIDITGYGFDDCYCTLFNFL